MSIVSLLCAWFVGGVLIVSGILKAGRAQAFQRTLSRLGLPSILHRSPWFSRSFSFVETLLGLAVILAPLCWRSIALSLATALFTAFFAISTRVVLAHEKVDCECFGGIARSRITGRTVVRNALFLAVSTVALVTSLIPPDTTSASGYPWAPAVVIFAIAMVFIVQRQRPPVESAQLSATPPTGELTFSSFDGTITRLGDLQEPPTHLVFLSPGCASCRHLVERLRWWPHGLREGDTLQPVFVGQPEEVETIREFAPLAPYALYDVWGVTAEALARTGFPGHIYVTKDNPEGAGWTTGPRAIEAAVLRPGLFEELDAREEI